MKENNTVTAGIWWEALDELRANIVFWVDLYGPHPDISGVLDERGRLIESRRRVRTIETQHRECCYGGGGRA